MTTRFLAIPEELAEQGRLRAEKARIAHSKRDARRTDKSHGKRKLTMRNRPFVVWDGEGPQDTGYSLLGCSLGDEICYPHLRTRDCLNLLLDVAERHPDAIHVAYGFNYDVSCMLWELSWRHLTALYKFNRVIWRDYVIEHIPRKWFKVRRGNVTIKIYDIASFFGGGLVSALEDWKIGPFGTTENVQSPETGVSSVTSVPNLATVQNMSENQLVRTFKKLRGDFQWKDIQQIAIYMRLELKYTKILIGELRESLAAANYVPRSWHGPGAVARMAFARHGIYNCIVDCPEPVALAARYAFIAGRFELFKAGHLGPVYTADINSAYPYYCSQLPNLAHGTWRRTSHFEAGRFGIYHISYAARPEAYSAHPLPYRGKDGMIAWPHQVTGWYWNPEAELVADNPDATFLEGWVFDEEDSLDRPFAWLVDYYQHRKDLKDASDPAQYAFKLILNSIYGQLAQRAGWDKKNNKAPKTHQLEYAGWITSSCRAAVYKVAMQCGDNLVSIDTDGVTSTQPFTWLENSKKLGGWELTSFSDSIFWQSGIYSLKTQKDGWSKAKTRGIPKGSYTVDQLFSCLENGSSLKLQKKVFISFGLAILGQKKHFNQWKVEPHEYEMGGSGKRYHYKGGTKRTIRCPDICGTDGVHKLALPAIFYGIAPLHSAPHKLPWINNREEMKQKEHLTSLVFYDLNDLDQDDEWILDYDNATA